VIALAYIGTIHEGVHRFLERAIKAGCTELYLIGASLGAEVRGYERDFTLPPDLVKACLTSLNLFKRIEIAEPSNLEQLKNKPLFANDHAVVRAVIAGHLPKNQVTWDHTFLRWDMPAALSQVPVNADAKTTTAALHKRWMKEASELTKHSGDFWRQVGAVAVRDGAILAAAWNEHSPYPDAPYVEGDPASWREAGKDVWVSTAIHAEQRVVAQASSEKGLSLKGADVYVTTFPCPTCANLLAHAGIARCFFRDGYSLLNAERTLREHGVELIQVQD
jgi:dCMP deaminase